MLSTRDPYGYFTRLFIESVIGGLASRGVEVCLEELVKQVKEPPNPNYGDLGFPVHRYAKKLGLNPIVLAEELASVVGESRYVLWARGLAGYVNVKFKPDYVARVVYSSIREYSDYGFNPTSKPLRIIVEHTSANPIHPLHIGHARNTFLGDTLAKLLRSRGHTVQTRFYINDAGRQVAILALGYRLLGEPDPPEKVKVDEWLGRIYALTNLLIEFKSIRDRVKTLEEKIKRFGGSEREVEEYKELLTKQDRLIADLGRLWEVDKELFDKLSDAIMGYQGDLEDEVNHIMKCYEEGVDWARKLVRRVVDLALEGIRETLSQLGIVFDKWDYESDLLWSSLVKKVVEDARKSRFFVLHKGVEAIDVGFYARDREVREKLDIGISMDIPPLILRRSDGTTLYTTRDIAYTLYKFRDFNADRVINVIGAEQRLPQTQLKLALYILGYRREAENLVTYLYEMVTIPGVKMSSRRYRIITIDWLLRELYSRARREVDLRRKDLSGEDRDRIAWAVAKAALRFYMVSSDPLKPLAFSFEKALSLKESSAPYLLYTYARANSILEKASGEVDWDSIDYVGGVDSSLRYRVVWLLSKLPWSVACAADQLSPEILAMYLLELADTFNKWYDVDRVLAETDYGLKMFKLALVYSVRRVVGNGLRLLGIEPLPHI